MKTDKYWEEYWEKEGIQGEVFINKNGGKPSYLSKLWKDYFNNFSHDISVVDIACGGGSIYLELPEPNNYKLYGIDISKEALNTAKARINGLHTLECPSTNIPLEDNKIHNVVSQFGIEYAGIDAFAEAIRILKNGGDFCFLTHCKDGYIDKQNKGKLNGALLVKECDFIGIADQLTHALYKKNKELVKDLHDKFSLIEPKIFEYKAQFPDGVHAHLYDGFRKLISNMQNYKCIDITDWLKSMKTELEKNIIRLKQMRNAALTESEVNDISILLKKNGVKSFNYEKFYAPDQSDPIGWLISGKK
jgi:ubiquinone/menaquinone biosynthesis C-methylase UbiE